jgi:hypothetical protein
MLPGAHTQAFVAVSSAHRSLFGAELMRAVRTLCHAPAASPLAAVNANQAVAVLLAMLEEAEAQVWRRRRHCRSEKCDHVLTWPLPNPIIRLSSNLVLVCFEHWFTILCLRKITSGT